MEIIVPFQGGATDNHDSKEDPEPVPRACKTKTAIMMNFNTIPMILKTFMMALRRKRIE